jgi:hypothetical protein
MEESEIITGGASGQASAPAPASTTAPPRPAPQSSADVAGTGGFAGGAYDVSLPADAPQALHLLGTLKMEPGGPPQTVHLPEGDAGEHQLLDLERHFDVKPAAPKTITPDPRMSAAK